MARYELKLPHMGESVAEATITSWLKKVGDTIEADDIIVEVATDKVDSQIPCEVSGVVTEILFDTEQVVQVGQVMAIIETPGASSEEENPVQTNAENTSDVVVEELQQIEKSTQNIINNTVHSTEERFYSPLVKTIAQTENISVEELNQIKGSGQDGRVTKNDILEYVKTQKAGNISQSLFQEVKSEVEASLSSEPVEEIPTENKNIQPDNSWDSWANAKNEEVSEISNEEIQPDKSWDSWVGTPTEKTLISEISTKDTKVDNSWDSWNKNSVEQVSTQALSISEEISVEDILQKTDIQPVTTSSESKNEAIVLPTFTHKVEFNHQETTNEVTEKVEVAASTETISETIATKTPQKEEKPNVKQNDDVEVIEMTRMGKLISKYMVESKRTSPHVQSFTEVDVTKIWNWRNKIKNKFEQREGEKFTFTPIFIEAVAKALRDFPMMNVSTDGERIFKKKHINIGMATALPNGDLIVPVIKNADTLSLVGLAKTVNDLANRARNNKLKPDDITGGTYTVTNIGSFGNVFGTPIINQPEVGILAIGTIQKVPAVIETPDGDVIGIRYKMMLSHSYDHRVVNGALGGMFVQRVAEYLEKWDTERNI